MLSWFLVAQLLLHASAAAVGETSSLMEPKTTDSQQQEMLEQTFAMIKPDVAGNDEVVAEIKAKIKRAGLTIEREEKDELNKDQALAFYAEDASKPAFEELIQFMTSGPVVKMKLVGVGAIKKWRDLLGPTDSNKAHADAPETIRALYGKDALRNAAHGSDSSESRARELALMFT